MMKEGARNRCEGEVEACSGARDYKAVFRGEKGSERMSRRSAQEEQNARA